MQGGLNCPRDSTTCDNCLHVLYMLRYRHGRLEGQPPQGGNHINVLCNITDLRNTRLTPDPHSIDNEMPRSAVAQAYASQGYFPCVRGIHEPIRLAGLGSWRRGCSWAHVLLHYQTVRASKGNLEEASACCNQQTTCQYEILTFKCIELNTRTTFAFYGRRVAREPKKED